MDQEVPWTQLFSLALNQVPILINREQLMLRGTHERPKGDLEFNEMRRCSMGPYPSLARNHLEACGIKGHHGCFPVQ
jgi:hypothetical protein